MLDHKKLYPVLINGDFVLVYTQDEFLTGVVQHCSFSEYIVKLKSEKYVFIKRNRLAFLGRKAD